MSGQSELTNDLLCQILENQAVDSKVLHELKGSMEARVGSLETTNRRQWWTQAVQAGSITVFGVTIKLRQMGII